jgi:imidazolonepropionase
MTDLNVIHAAQLVRVLDRGGPRRGEEQGVLDALADGAVAVRDGAIVAAGDTEAVLRDWDDGAPTLDASGRTVVPGLIECHSHPLFAGERHAEYADRLAGASLAEVAKRGGGIWASVQATRAAPDEALLEHLARAYAQVVAGGVTTLEVKSGYGLSAATDLHHLDLLQRSRALTPLQLVVSFLGAHVVPAGLDADGYTADVIALLPRVLDQGIAAFHDLTCERGLFTPSQAARLLDESRRLGIPTRVHADAWAPSEGWTTAVAGGATSAEHLTYTADDRIRATPGADAVAVLLPQAELIYMTDRRAGARVFIEQDIPLAVATDYCSSIHASSLVATMGLAAPWYRLTPAEVIVAATLNAAYALGLGADRGSLDVGKRGDLTILSVAHPEELFLAVGQDVVSEVVAGGRVIYSAHDVARTLER